MNTITNAGFKDFSAGVCRSRTITTVTLQRKRVYLCWAECVSLCDVYVGLLGHCVLSVLDMDGEWKLATGNSIVSAANMLSGCCSC